MSKKNDELDIDELKELLKDPSEQRPAPKKPQAKAAEPKTPEPKTKEDKNKSQKSKTVITEKRKLAMVWYLVGLFGIALVIVLASLLINGNRNQNPADPSTTSQVQELYDNINELEAENAELTKQNYEYEAMVDGLNTMIDDLNENLEHAEENNFYSADSEQYKRAMQAYQLLVRAQNALIVKDGDAIEAAVKELEPMLDVLDDEGKNAYYMVVEYMEMPSLDQ